MQDFDLKRFLVENQLTRNSLLEMTVSDFPQFGKPTTTFDKLEPKPNQPSEPYTYDEPSLLDFVKKHVEDIEMDITGQYHNTYPSQYSVNDVSEYEGIVFIGGNKNAPTVAILDHTPTQRDLELTGTNKDDWRLEFDRVHIPGTSAEGPLKQGVNYIKKNYYWYALVPDKPTLKENKMNDFDLKKFLVENRMTRNSRLLNEYATYDTLPEEVKQSYNGGKILSVVFVKSDGTVRPMAFSKFTKAYKPSENPKSDAQANVLINNNLMVGYDRNVYNKLKKELGSEEEAAKKSWRRFKLDQVLGFLAGGRFFDLREENNIPPEIADQLTDRMKQAAAAELNQAENGDTQLDEYGFDFDGMGGSNNSQSVKASFEGKWNPVPKANKDVLDKSTGKDTQLVGVFGQFNYAIAKGSDGKFYRYQYRQASTPGTPKGPFDTIEKAKEGIK